MKLIIFWQAFTYKYCTVLSIIQLAGEIKTVHFENFYEYLEEKSRQANQTFIQTLNKK